MAPKILIFLTMINFCIVYYLPRRRRPGTRDIATPPVRPSVCLSVRPSVCLSVTFSFRTVTQKTHWCIFSKLCRYVHHVMGVCCIVFDIDGMLFEFFFQYFTFSSRFMLFPTLKQKIGVKKIKIPGGGGGVDFFFLEKQFFLISRFMLFSTLNKNIEKCPFTYWLIGRWFLQIVERDSCNLY